MSYGVKKFRKKPVVIEALQFNGSNATEVMLFVGQRLKATAVPAGMELERDDIPNEAYTIEILSREGILTAIKMDWIIKGYTKEAGIHCWVCKPDYFITAYELAEDQETDWLKLYEINAEKKDIETSPAELRH